MTVGTIKGSSAAFRRLHTRSLASDDSDSHPQEAALRAWQAALGQRPADPSMTLKAAGCDSLALLQYRYALEQHLGRPVPLDLIDVDMTAARIAAVLSRLPDHTPPAADPRPTVFLLPGLDDDEPRLARFRVGLRSHVRFHLVEYPDWPDMMRPGWGFADLVEAVLGQMVTTAQGGPILMTGYSFGGEVAFAVARRLVARGHDLRWLGILDTDLTRVPGPPGGGPLTRLRHALWGSPGDAGNGPHKTAGLLLAKLARQLVGLPRLHRSGTWWRRALPSRTGFWFDRRTRSIFRVHAIWAWMSTQPQAVLDAPVTLFRSAEGLGPSPAHMGWAARCPRLTIVPVDGDHHTLFDPPHCQVLYARYAAAVAEIATRQPKSAETQPV